MNPTVRFILAVLAGVFAGGAVVAGIEALGHWIYPVPATHDPSAICEYLETAPVMALVFPLIAWTLGAFIAGLIAKLVYRTNNKPAFVAGAIQLLFILINFFLILCHPIWMEVLGAIIPVPMAMLGSRLIASR